LDIILQEVKKSGSFKPQVEMYKKQVSELHQKLGDETKRADKVDFENRKLQEKLQALSREKEVGNTCNIKYFVLAIKNPF
jgi:regulator of replication initiation timing